MESNKKGCTKEALNSSQILIMASSKKNQRDCFSITKFRIARVANLREGEAETGENAISNDTCRYVIRKYHESEV